MQEAAPIWITGLGAVSAAGSGVEESLQSFDRGWRSPAPVSLFETPLRLPVFEVRAEVSAPAGQRTHHLAWMAAREALRAAGRTDLQGLRAGVALGTTVACQLNDLEFYSTWRREGHASMEEVDRYLQGNLAEFIARRTGADGPAVTVANACSSGADAIGLAAGWLRAGRCDLVIAGGADEINRVPLCGFNALGVASSEPCRPFDRDRSGLNLGEGAGVLVLETDASARARGAPRELELAGWGFAADAYHLTAPHPQGRGLRRAIDCALKLAGIASGEVAFVNAHGTSTRENDRTEGRVLSEGFPSAHILSTKGYTGHTLGAAGGLEAVFTAAALRAGWIPASIGWKTYDEETGVRPVVEKTAIGGDCAVSTSLAFGGSNAALVIRRRS